LINYFVKSDLFTKTFSPSMLDILKFFSIIPFPNLFQFPKYYLNTKTTSCDLNLLCYKKCVLYQLGHVLWHVSYHQSQTQVNMWQSVYFQVGRDLIEDETAETDRVKFEIYVYYAKAIGVALSVASVGLYACFQVRIFQIICHTFFGTVLPPSFPRSPPAPAPPPPLI
jgi:hypothetical protein